MPLNNYTSINVSYTDGEDASFVYSLEAEGANPEDIYLEKEAEIRAILSEMPTADEIKKMLSLVELDMADFYAAYGKEKINNAIRYAKDLKDRYTVLWVYYDVLGGKE